MNRSTFAVQFLLLTVVVFLTGCATSAQHNIQADYVKESIWKHMKDTKNNTITIKHPDTQKNVTLTFDHVHDRVKKTQAGRYLVSTNFRGPDGTVYDLDFYVDEQNGSYRVEDTVLHKIGEKNYLSEEERNRLNRTP